MGYEIKPLGIKSWAEDDRPREKMLLKGKAALSDAELLAILLGQGTKNFTAVDLAKEVLRLAENDLYQLSRLTIVDLKKIKGIGTAKAVTIMAALELGRRRRDSAKVERPKITGSQSVYDHFKPYLSDLKHEEFWILCISRNLEIQKTIQVSSGGSTGTVVDPKIIFKHAIENLANGLILCHNHPSGSLKASHQDIHLTKKIVEAGKLMDVVVADHLIFTDTGYFSFADNGLI